MIGDQGEDIGLPKDGIVHVVLPEAERERGLRVKPLEHQVFAKPGFGFQVRGKCRIKITGTVQCALIQLATVEKRWACPTEITVSQ